MNATYKQDRITRAHTVVLVLGAVPLLLAVWMLSTVSATFWPLFLEALVEQLPVIGIGDVRPITLLVISLIGITIAPPMFMIIAAAPTITLARRWKPRMRSILEKRAGSYVFAVWMALAVGLPAAYSTAHSRGVTLLREDQISALLTLDVLTTALIACSALIGTAASAFLSADLFRRLGISS